MGPRNSRTKKLISVAFVFLRNEELNIVILSHTHVRAAVHGILYIFVKVRKAEIVKRL